MPLNHSAPAATGFETVEQRARRSTANVVILTSGLTGSSVLTGLIARGGYWTGDTTVRKEYDTHENTDLVRLNNELLAAIGFGREYTTRFSHYAIESVAALAGTIDETAYRAFVDRCDIRAPWVWKDPRLWLTIRFWARFLNLDRCRFVVVTRDPMHLWVSCALRRQIISLPSLKRYETAVQNSILAFLASRGLPFARVKYEDLICRPEGTIAALNKHLGSKLSVRDLGTVYRGPLYRTPRNGPHDYLKALMIYARNHSRRARV